MAKRTIKRRSTDEVEWNQAIKVMWALGLYEGDEHWSTLRDKLLKLGRLEPTKKEGFYCPTAAFPVPIEAGAVMARHGMRRSL
jgi:hypothetical protein